MFTTPEQVKEFTGYDVDASQVAIAQSLIEAYVGRVEVEVTNAVDQALLGKATAYQTVYMRDNPDLIFEQAAIVQTTQFGSSATFRQDGVSPFVAPLAVIACQRLSWKRIRSVKTGSIYSTAPTTSDPWFTE